MSRRPHTSDTAPRSRAGRIPAFVTWLFSRATLATPPPAAPHRDPGLLRWLARREELPPPPPARPRPPSFLAWLVSRESLSRIGTDHRRKDVRHG